MWSWAVGLGPQFQVLNSLRAVPALTAFSVLIYQAGQQQQYSIMCVAGNIGYVNIQKLRYVISAQQIVVTYKNSNRETCIHKEVLSSGS